MKRQLKAWFGFVLLVSGGCGSNTSPGGSGPALSVSNVSATTVEDTPIEVDLAPAAAAGIEFVVVTAPTHGSLSTVNGHVATYTPAANYAGADTFTFAAVRGSERAEATATLTITAVDDAATPANDSFTVARWESATALASGDTSVLDNDSDVDGGPVATATLVSAPTHGVLTLNLDGTFSYIHDGSADTSDSFTYATAPGAQATVAITVGPEVPPALLNLNFNAGVTSAVHVGDAWFVGGRFTYADMIPAGRLVQLNLTGQPTGCSVNEGFDDVVTSIVDIGGNLYVSGPFTKYRGQPANRIAKISAATCALDTTFNPTTGPNGFDYDVRRLATDGTSIFAVGLFTEYRGASAKRIAKLSTDGVLDATFMGSPNGFNAEVQDIKVAGNSVFVGGNFTDYRDVANVARYIAHLDKTSGALQNTFGPVNTNGFNGGVSCLALNGDATALFVGGGFTTYTKGGTTTLHQRIAKIFLQGEDVGVADTDFVGATNGFDNNVSTLEFADGALFVGGAFDNYREPSPPPLPLGNAHRIAKLDPENGNLSAAFNPPDPASNGFTGWVTSINSIGGGAIIAGGQPLGAYRGAATDISAGFAKLATSDGAIDTSFLIPAGHDRSGIFELEENNASNVKSARVVGSTIWLGGKFTVLGGRSANRIARFKDSDGSLDTTFSPPASNGFNDEVLSLATSGDALYVGGLFTDYRGQTDAALHIAKLNPVSGALDTTFSPAPPATNGFDSGVYALLFSNGALYAGGEFHAYRDVANSALAIAKLDPASGALDTTFSPPGLDANGFDDTVYAIAAKDDHLIVGGDFTRYRGVVDSAKSIAKINATTGVQDTTFSPPSDNGFNNTVYAVAVHGDSAFVGGSFDAYRSTLEIGYVAKLSLADGALDTVFTAPGSNSGFSYTVYALTMSGGSLYAGGEFFGYRGDDSAANYLAKLNPATGALDTVFTPAGASNGNGGVYSLTPYRDSILAGGYFANCQDGTCYQNASRFNRDTRAAQ